jgi:hypothetical protein
MTAPFENTYSSEPKLSPSPKFLIEKGQSSTLTCTLETSAETELTWKHGNKMVETGLTVSYDSKSAFKTSNNKNL